MDQLPALPQGLPVFWGTMFVLLNVAVTLFCSYVIPAILKLREANLGVTKYADERADKGYQAVISQQKQDKDAMAAVIDEKEAELKTVNDKFTESVRLAERYKTQWENADAQIKELRDEDKKKTVLITELRAEVERLKDHERRNVANNQHLAKQVNAKLEELGVKPIDTTPPAS